MIKIKTTTGLQVLDLSLLKIIKPVVKTRTPDFDSYDIVMHDGTVFDIFEKEFPRDEFLNTIVKNSDGVYIEKKKFLGIF